MQAESLRFLRTDSRQMTSQKESDPSPSGKWLPRPAEPRLTVPGSPSLWHEHLRPHQQPRSLNLSPAFTKSSPCVVVQQLAEEKCSPCTLLPAFLPIWAKEWPHAHFYTQEVSPAKGFSVYKTGGSSYGSRILWDQKMWDLQKTKDLIQPQQHHPEMGSWHVVSAEEGSSMRPGNNPPEPPTPEPRTQLVAWLILWFFKRLVHTWQDKELLAYRPQGWMLLAYVSYRKWEEAQPQRTPHLEGDSISEGTWKARLENPR